MSKYISAGHCKEKGPTYDSGAEGVNGRLEASETVRLRDGVINKLISRGFTDIIKDANNESLVQYLNRIKPGNASTVLEFHFDAYNGKASGTTALVKATPSANSVAFGKRLALATSTILGIPLRDGGDGDGVMTEADSHRGRLGLMREEGIVCLLEVCFIDNAEDMKKYDAKFDELCEAYADIVQEFDDLIK